jgi:amino acid adenylation domain-containing protein
MNLTHHEPASTGTAPIGFDPFGFDELEGVAVPTNQQREVWAAAQLGEQASLAYNLPVAIRIRGELDTGILTAAIDEIVKRHDAMRASFSADGDSLCFAKELHVSLHIDDQRVTSPYLARIRTAEAATPLDLVKGPLVRFRLLTLGDTDHCLLITAHHLVWDGWSVDVLCRELLMIYAARRDRKPLSLEEAPSFRKYAAACESSSAQASRQRQEEAWVARLQDVPPFLELPLDRPRPPMRSFSAGHVSHALGSEARRALASLGSASGCTPFMTLAGLYFAFLHRISSQDAIIVGVPAAGQPSAGLPGLVGHCASMLPVPSRLQPGTTIRDFLAGTRAVLLDATEDRDCSFGKLVERLGVPRNPASIPLVQAVFNFDRATELPAINGLECSLSMTPKPFDNFEWFLNAVAAANSLTLDVTFKTDLFDPEIMRHRLMELETFILAAAAEPLQPLAQLNIVPPEELHLLHDIWGQGPHRKLTANHVDELIERALHSRGDAPAVSDGERSLGYRELDQASRLLADQLIRLGAGPGKRVGVMLAEGVDLVVVLLAILRSGAACVPFAPDDADKRLSFMIEESGVMVLLTNGLDRAALRTHRDRVVLVQELLQDVDLPVTDHVAFLRRKKLENSAVDRSRSPDDPACVLYTSGSTGLPNGVVLPHRAVVNLLESSLDAFGIEPGDRWMLLTESNFDISVLDTFLPLAAGAHMRILKHNSARDGGELVPFLKHYKPTVLHATPAIWQTLINKEWQGDPKLKALCGGETLAPQLAGNILARVGELWNLYGPTETCGHVLRHEVRPDDDPVPIGRPVSNTRVRVVDENRQAVPVGVAGELLIGGKSVALQYLKRTGVSAEKFIRISNKSMVDESLVDESVADDNVAALAPEEQVAPDMLFYRTGDRVRYRQDGVLEFIGRMDTQVKINGHRVETGEVESVLLSFDDIRQAVVVLQSDADPARLVAHIEPVDAQEVDAELFRSRLASRLPAYMIPRGFIVHDRLPRIANGNVDRPALQEHRFQDPGFQDTNLQDRDLESSTHIAETAAPLTGAQHAVSRIWQEVLGTEAINMNDNFFELGGHSLLAARIVTRLRAQYGVALPMSAIFLTPTIAELAEHPELAALHVPSETGINLPELETPVESREEIEL